MPPFFTVFTPTHNRAHTLLRVHDSLVRQTEQDFEWVIVDDGSTDGTVELVEHWRSRAQLTIRYLTQPHRGKHVAFNRAVKEARGVLLCPLDSDDECTPDALQCLREHWESIPPQQRDGFVGVSCHCADERGQLIGRPFPAEVIDSDAREMFYRYRVEGELWGAARPDVLAQYLFREDLERTYIPEGTVWFAIARRYRCRYVRRALRVYHDTTDSLVSGKDPAVNAVGNRVAYLRALNDDLAFATVRPFWFLRAAVQYVRFSRHAGVSLVQCLREARSSARLLVAAAVPAGLAVHATDRRRPRRVTRQG